MSHMASFQKYPRSNYEIEILNNWHHRTGSSRFTAIVFQPNLICFSGSTAIFFGVKNELSFFSRFIMKTKEQSQQMKRESKATYAESRNVRATR